MVRIALAALVALAACHGGGAGTGAPCEALGAKFASLARADLAAAKDLDPELRRGVDGLIAPMRDGMVRACKDDAWSPASRDCFAGAADVKALSSCYAQLTAAQRASLDKAAAGSGSGSQ